MSFTRAISSCFSKYATFSGRASRSEYWWFALMCVLMIGLTAAITPILAAIAYAGIFLPSISVVVRRLHDLDKSGWYYWITLIPLVGAILLLVWFCTKGTDGNNRFGRDVFAGIGPSTGSPAISPSSASMSVVEKAEQLAKIKSLLESGAITEPEYDKMKAELLA